MAGMDVAGMDEGSALTVASKPSCNLKALHSRDQKETFFCIFCIDTSVTWILKQSMDSGRLDNCAGYNCFEGGKKRE